jgi:hypothetical protein
MEILAVIGIIALLVLIFFGGGIIGWILQAMGYVFGKLFEGCQTTFGCLFVTILIVLFLLAMII